MWGRFRQLRNAGVLGMNRRNVDYIAVGNPRARYPLVDDKLQTKILAKKAGIATPELYGVVRYESEARRLSELLLPHREFVIKPTHGSAGKGILVVTDRQGEHFVRANGQEVTKLQIHRHVSNILSGLHSLGGREDAAIIEAVIHFTELFEDYTFEGVPDIRIVVFRGYPVMAMTRISTRRSGGRANLHQGAVGLGLDIATGHALLAVMHGRPLTTHPDTGRRFSDLVIPAWPEMLELAASCYDITRLDYLGVDIVLDRDLGPLVIELNARPGLAIQIANGQGLLPRLAAVEALNASGSNARERARYAAQHFGHSDGIR